MKKINRLLSLVLCICMVLTMMPVTALSAAAEGANVGQVAYSDGNTQEDDTSSAVSNDTCGELGDHSFDADGKCGCGLEATISVTDGTAILYAVDAAGLKAAVAQILSAGTTEFTVNLPADASAELFQEIRSAVSSAPVEEGSIVLTITGATSIPSDAFFNCFDLGAVTIPASVTKIEEDAFFGCVNLKTVTFEEGSNLKSIGDNAFYNCRTLTSIDVPAGVTTIGFQTFLDCDELQTVHFAQNAKLETIGKNAFRECKKLAAVTIPASVTTIEGYAFYDCEALETVTFEAGSKLNKIGATAFGETAITAIDIPTSVTVLEMQAFVRCANLTSIVIPAGVTSIEINTFSGCSQLTAITFLAPNAPALDQYGLNRIENLSVIYVPSASVEAYKTAEIWSNYSDLIQPHVCSGGQATCIKQAECEICGIGYGELGDHSYENGFCTNEGVDVGVCDAYEPARQNDDGDYEIENAGNLYWFARLVNIDGVTDANAKLMADIDLENRVWYPIGLYNDVAEAGGEGVIKQYQGTVDGNCHTVSNFTAIGTGSQGLLGYTGTNAVVKNLGVVGATVSGWNAGAVMAYMGTVENCYAVDCAITGYTNADATAIYVGAVAGTQQAVVNNCFAYDCEIIAGEGMTEKTILSPVGGKTVTNCYYGEITAINGKVQIRDGETCMNGKFATGEVAYLLGGVWGQTIGEDSYPIPGGKTVYYAYVDCEDKVKTYTNDSTAPNIPGHSYDETTGKCGICNESIVASATIGGSAVYCTTLNGAIQAVKDCTAEDQAVVKVLVDIDMGEQYQVIESGVFIFDLNGKEIISESKLSGVLTVEGGVVTITDSSEGGKIVNESYAPVVAMNATANITGGSFSGFVGVCAYENTIMNISGGSFTNCIYGVDADVSSSVSITGGVFSENFYGVEASRGSTVNITGGSFSENDVDILIYDASDGSTVVLTLADGATEGATFAGGITVEGTTLSGILGLGAAYWQGDKQIAPESDATSITGGDVVIKTPCAHTGSRTPEYAWNDPDSYGNCYVSLYLRCCSCGRVVDNYSEYAELTDSAEGPNCLNPGYAAYTVTFEIDGETYTDSKTFALRNDNHIGQFADGFCSACGGYEKPDTTENDWGETVHQISNAGELYWFAQYVNEDGDRYATGVLVSDIVIPETAPNWVPIGGYDANLPYCGAFDGQGHTISGLKCVTEGKYAGLFGYTDYNNVIQNVGVVNSSFEGTEYVGGLIGCGYTTVQNCFVLDTTVKGDGYNVGAFMGYNGGSVSNCLVIGGSFTDSSYGSYENCFVLSDTESEQAGITAVSAEKLASGEVAYLLQGEQESEIWGQTIGEDAYPVLGGPKVYYGYDSCAEDAEIGYTNTEATEEKPDHSDKFTCTDNGDGTHKKACSVCDFVMDESETHTFDSATGKCVCGLQAQALVTIGDSAKGYRTLDEAIQAVKDCTAEDKAVVKLMVDIDLGGSEQKITSGVFTIDLDGRTISGTGNYVLYLNGSGVDVTITDSGEDGTISLIGENAYGVYGDSCTVTINGGTISATGSSVYGVYAINSSKVTITDGEISGTNFGVYAKVNCMITISGGKISGNSCVCAKENSAVTISGGTFSGITGVNVSESTLTITGGTISGTYSGVYATDSVTVTISGGTISGDDAGVYTRGGTLTITGGTISGNRYDLLTYDTVSTTIILTLGENGEGATFPGGLDVSGFNLDAILGEGAAYWQGDKQITPESDATSITGGDVTVKAAVVETPKFDITLANLTLGNDLTLYFYIPGDAYPDWTGTYAVVTKPYADGTDTASFTVPFEAWNPVVNDGENLYQVAFSGIAAKEMTDVVTVEVFNADGEAISNVGDESIRSYLTRMMEQNSNDAIKMRMAVDMLNYGAAAQEYFGYNIDDLANKDLTDAQKAYGTSTVPECENSCVKDANVRGMNLTLENRILMNVYFKGLTEDMTARVTFTNHAGRVIDEDLGEHDGNRFVIDQLAVADARQKITVTVYNADGSVYSTCTDSVESYTARARAAQANGAELYEAIMNFADSAKVYLENKN